MIICSALFGIYTLAPAQRFNRHRKLNFRCKRDKKYFSIGMREFMNNVNHFFSLNSPQIELDIYIFLFSQDIRFAYIT